MARCPSAREQVLSVTNLSQHPLSFSQERLWFIDRFESTGSLYNVAKAFEIRGALHHDALGRALDAIVARHAVLRTNFSDVQGEAVQIIRPVGPADFRIEELSGSSALSTDDIEQRLRAEAARPFDLEHDPPFRVRLLTTVDRHVSGAVDAPHRVGRLVDEHSLPRAQSVVCRVRGWRH